MFISDFAIRRPIITVVVTIALAVFGIAALARLQTDEFPDIDAPIVFIGIVYPGASPDQVEREVVDRLEDRISGISGLDQLTSTSSDGFAQIIVQFKFDKPTDEATQDVRDAISAVRAQLPSEIIEPIVQRFDPAQQPIVSLALTSLTLTPAQLTQIGDQVVGGELRAIAGVAQVQVSGADSATLNVVLDPARLGAAGVGVDQVVGALRAQNLAAPVGQLTGPVTERAIRLEGRLERPEDFAQLIVTQRNGVPVRLGDVATVQAGSAERRSAALYNGREAIGLDIVKSKGYSTTTVSDAIKARLPALQAGLPQGTTIEVVRDAGTRVRASVRSVQEALIEGAVLTVLALPISVLASFVPLMLFGFTLNTMSLLGLSLAIGILIDDAIVVRENIVRHVEMGKDHYTAAREGTAEIGLAVAATTFSIVVVFVPIAFMGDLAGQWFQPFALTIACSVLVSLFVSFSLDPMLSAYWPDPHLEPHQRSWVGRLLVRFNNWFDRQAEGYKRVIGWALDHRFAMAGLAVLSLVGALALPATGIVGGAFFPDADNSEMLINIETPPGSSLDYTILKSEEAARLARAMPEVRYTYTTIGGRTEAVDEGIVYVRLTPKKQRARHQKEVEAALRAQLVRLGGVTASIGSGNFENQKQIQLQLQGPDSRELTRLATEVRAAVEQVPGAVDVGLSTRGQKPELEVTVDRALAGSVGVTVGQVARTLRVAFAGLDAGDWIDPSGETRDVYVRLSPEARANVRDLASLPLFVAGPEGVSVPVPLGQVARVKSGVGPARIDHLDRERVIAVQANTQNRPLTEVLKDIQPRLASVTMPPGYTVRQGGESEDQQEVFG